VKWWKVAGLAGVAGVAATGVAVARAQRQRNAYTPEEVHARLRERAAAAGIEADRAGDRTEHRTEGESAP
jgi:hypothetical protein